MTLNFFQNDSHNSSPSNGFQNLFYAHLTAVLVAQNEMVEGQQQLEAKESIRPMECDDIMLKLRTFLSSVKGFEGLLKDSTKLPSDIASKRYKVFISLSYTEEHVKQIISLLSSYRSICLKSSSETYELLEEIRDNVNALLQTSEKLEMEAEEMLTKSHTNFSAKSPSQAHYVN